jgi:RNA polymerase sigma factor (sigma-70 family)
MVNQHLSWCRHWSRRPERVTDEVPEPRGGGLETSVRDELGLWPLVTAMPRRQRSAVVLRFYEGLSVQETSRVLRCSPGTVKSTTHRGLANLRRRAVEAGLEPVG